MRAIIGSAHPLEKSAPGIEDISIHGFLLRWVNVMQLHSMCPNDNHAQEKLEDLITLCKECHHNFQLRSKAS